MGDIKAYYDLHIHSALSPCSDNDMTPNNIVNMSYLKGLDVIAVSDHNSIGNCKSVISVAEKAGILALPAMEVETSEEVHILTLFPDIYCAEKFYQVLKSKMPKIKNRKDIFGTQLLFDSDDNVIGEEENLLVTASDLSIDEVKEYCDVFDGVAIPAHIDRNSYSVLSNLGMIPDIGFSCFEISKNANYDDYRKYGKIITNSDAHYLFDINERVNFVEISKITPEVFIGHIKKNM